MGTTGRQDGMRIRLLRVERDITVVEFASRIGISRHFLTSIERRRKAASLTTLVKIADEFGVPVDDLIVRDKITGSAPDAKAAA
jgi:transcriptional regulator with XRE-family HTH domain